VRDRLRAAWAVGSKHPAADLALALVRRYRAHSVGTLASSLAYYAAVSLGPILLVLGGWLGLMLRANPELAEPYRAALEELVRQMFPLTEDAASMVQQSVDAIVFRLGEGAILRSLLSFVVLLWAATNFFSSLQFALERIFSVSAQRNFLRKRVVAVLLVLAVAAFVAFEVIGATVADATAQLWAGLAATLEEFDVALPELRLPWLFSPLRLLAVAAVLTLSFRLLPREHSDWFSALIGGMSATLALAALRQILVATVSVERITLIYGVVTGVVILLWLYLALLVFLLAATLTAELAHRRASLRARLER
jgi:membrane protein